MKSDPRSILAGFLALLVLAGLTAFPAVAQEAEGDEDDTGRGRFYVEFEGWIAQAAGLEFEPATQLDPTDPFGARVLSADHSTEAELRYRGGFEFSKNIGSVVFTWYSHDEEVVSGQLRPGDFVIGESLAHPLYAGYANDGLADGYNSLVYSSIRDFRLDFYRTAFRSSRVEAKWFAGYRDVSHQREHDVSYFGLLPGFPALIPPLTAPRPDLDPLPDVVALESSYKGRGLEGGMDFLMPVWRDKVKVEAGFAVAVLRGEVDTQYRSTTHFYLLDDGTNPAVILSAPYDEFGMFTVDPLGNVDAVVDDITQRDFQIGLRADSRSQSSDVIEAYLGVRWQALSFMDVYAGFRSTSYSDIGVDLRPASITGLNPVNVVEVDRSATYEGFYGGLGFSF